MHGLDAGRLPVKIWNALAASSLMPRQQSFLPYRQISRTHITPAAVHENKRKEKTAPFGINLMRNQAVYRAAQVLQYSTKMQSRACLELCHLSATLHQLVCQQCKPHTYSSLPLLLHVPCRSLCHQQDMPMSHSHERMPCSEARCLRKDQRELGSSQSQNIISDLRTPFLH